jgi:hypothetical protein
MDVNDINPLAKRTILNQALINRLQFLLILNEDHFSIES